MVDSEHEFPENLLLYRICDGDEISQTGNHTRRGPSVMKASSIGDASIDKIQQYGHSIWQPQYWPLLLGEFVSAYPVCSICYAQNIIVQKIGRAHV